MISYPCTLVCYCRFDTVFIFSVNLYWYQNVFKSIPTNIVSLFGKTILMPNNWPSHSVLRWMSVVRNLEIRNMVLLCWHVFVLDFFASLMCVWLEKTTVLFICIHKRVKSIVFATSIKFCDESGLAILNTNTVHLNRMFDIKNYSLNKGGYLCGVIHRSDLRICYRMWLISFESHAKF